MLHYSRTAAGRGPARAVRARASALTTASLAALTLAVGGAAGVAHAQDKPADQSTVKEVVVTGSRISRRDFTSSSPIVTVNEQKFRNTANVAVEATLNKLPQFTADQDLTGAQNSGDVQPTATHSVGISTASLRGLGANRNLVLVDGQRMMPANGELVVDLNAIPTAAIEGVEIITGGASAVYGADAVAGVVNFKLKKNFQGVDLDTQWGQTEAGDGQEFKISALFGTNFADDKGNVMFGLEHFTRAPSYQKNRDFYTKSWSDPTVGTNEFFDTGSAFAPLGNNPSQAVVDGIFSQAVPGGASPGAVANSSTFYFNNDGTVYTGTASLFGANSPGGAYRFNGTFDGASVAHVNVLDNTGLPFGGGPVASAIKTNQTNYYVTSPINRYSMYGAAHYDFTDYLTGYVSGNYVSTHTSTVLFPTPFITGWGVVIPYDSGTNGVASLHPVSAELATLLNSRASPNAPWELEIIPDPSAWMPPRSTVDDNTEYQMTAGIKGKIPNADVSYELYGSHGRSTNYSLGNGYASLVRYQDLLTSPNYGQGVTLTGNQGPPNFGFGAASVHCTSGFYSAIFEGGTPSQDCINAITAHIQDMTAIEQNVVEFSVQGGLFNLPAGQVRGSLGASYRDDSIVYNPDILQSTSSFTDQVAGVYPAAYMDAATSAREGFGELLVPVLKDLPLVKSFNLELGGRYSTYTAENRLTGQKIEPNGGWTYKILGDWAVNDWLSFRGGYNLAVRAPNVGELFLGKQEVYAAGAATAYGDPCSLNATAPWGANPHPNGGSNANAANAQAICQALMGPTGSAFYYSQPQAPGAPSPFGFVEQEGNSNLTSETAKTWTAGVVLRSPSQNPLLSGMTASVDWYRIAITGAIEFQSVDDVKEACLTMPAAQAIGSPECSLLSRNPGTGQEDVTTIQYNNLATIKTSGIDVNFNWRAELADMGLKEAPGALTLNVLFNWLDYFDTQTEPGAPVRNWAGTLGPNLTGTNAGAFKYKVNTTLTYSVGPASLALNWRYLPHVHPQTWGQAGNTYLDTPAYHVFGLYGTYAINRTYELRAGVDNLFNVDPPITGAQTGIPGFSLATSGQGTTNEGLYDALGRRFYVGLHAKF
jgi:outer membrane receptor protein involved in Fe transport